MKARYCNTLSGIGLFAWGIVAAQASSQGQTDKVILALLLALFLVANIAWRTKP